MQTNRKIQPKRLRSPFNDILLLTELVGQCRNILQYGKGRGQYIPGLTSHSVNKSILLPCLQTIRFSDRDSRTVIGRTRLVTSPIWSRIDWLTGPKICIVGFSFAELDMDKTVHVEVYLPSSGRSKH